MYNVDEKVFKKVLLEAFKSAVGNSCETIEHILKEDINKAVSCKLIKDALKKYAYNAMRSIDEQISSFDKGTKISVKFQRPISE